MDVGDHDTGARDILPKLGDDDTGVGDSQMCAYRKFGLGMPS